MKAFVFTLDALVALLVVLSLLSFAYAAQEQMAFQQASRFSSDLAQSFKSVEGGLSASQIRAIYSLESKCGAVILRNASLAPVKDFFACDCPLEDSVASASMADNAGQAFLIEVHSCPA